MQCTRNVTNHIIWVGANDRRLNLFENLFPIPRGVSYNAYLIKDEKNTLMDTVDASASRQFIENVAYALNGESLDYLVVQHMEPDHCANIQKILELYPEAKVVGNAKTMQMIGQFFDVDLEDVENLDDKEIVALSNAQAWETESDEYISIANIEYELEAKEGQYPVTFSTANGTSIERTIFVVNQPFVKNEKANEGVMAFNFFKTVDEITESQALDTDLKTWANAQGWKLTDEDQSVDISVDYDFDPEEVTEGVYEITFSTTGREFKIHTTDYSEEGQEVGLTFFPEDIHVMPKVVF